MTRALRTCVVLMLVGCSAPDPFPGADALPPPGRRADGLLDRPALQAVVEATLARDGAALRALLADPDPAVRARAAYGLGSVQDPAARDALVDLLADMEAPVREDAAFALGQLEGGVGAEVSRALADEPDLRVRKALVEAIGKAGGADEMDALLALREEDLLADATLALSRGMIRGVAPETVLDTLVARMVHPEPRVRRAAAYFVSRLPNADPWERRFRDVTGVLSSYGPADEAAMYVLTGLSRGGSFFLEPVAVSWLRSSPDWRIRPTPRPPRRPCTRRASRWVWRWRRPCRTPRHTSVSGRPRRSPTRRRCRA
jgi:hypothetical protein